LKAALVFPNIDPVGGWKPDAGYAPAAAWLKPDPKGAAPKVVCEVGWL